MPGLCNFGDLTIVSFPLNLFSLSFGDLMNLASRVEIETSLSVILGPFGNYRWLSSVATDIVSESISS